MPKEKKQTPLSFEKPGNARLEKLRIMQQRMIDEHSIACSYLTHLSTQPDIADLAPADQRSLIQSGLEKYAAIAQKMLAVLEKLTDHERALSALVSPEGTNSDSGEPPPDSLQWDMLIRHAHRQLKKPLPSLLAFTDEDISNP